MAQISVIIPVVNEVELLPHLLAYLKKCDEDNNLEIIVVDGKSDDGTLAEISDSNLVIVESEIRCRAHQMNLGAAKATTEILYFVHADVIPPKNFISEVLSAHYRGIRFGFFRQKFDKMNIFLWFNSFFTRYKKSWCRGGDQTIYITKELFKILDGYDEKFVIMEEYDLMKRALVITDYDILNGETIVSTRKYETNSWFNVMVANLKAVRQFKKGVEPQVIRETYLEKLNPY
jgi:rSAM/selenodomain-associated transferase 2